MNPIGWVCLQDPDIRYTKTMSIAARRLQRRAASGGLLYSSPSTGSYSNGATVTVQIRMNSGGTAVNAVQANLSYPATRLQFSSINTTGSPFTTTIQNSGGGGTVQLGVGILAGSTSGDQLVGTVTFTAISTGSATVAFTAGSGIARASDSTDICQNKVGATYTIT